MGRPKKEVGNWTHIRCAQCGKEGSRGFKVDLSIRACEVTPNFFIAYDPIEDYDMFLCSKECLVSYIKELENGRGNGKD